MVDVLARRDRTRLVSAANGGHCCVSWGARVRTEALRLKRPLLCQLSYTPLAPWQRIELCKSRVGISTPPQRPRQNEFDPSLLGRADAASGQLPSIEERSDGLRPQN